MSNANILRVERHNKKLLSKGGDILNGIRLSPEASKCLKKLVEVKLVSKTKIINDAVVAYYKDKYRE